MSENSHFAVAIDGPAASGKSTVAKRLAKRLDLIMINTGAMYRAIAWAVDISCGVKDGMSTILINDVDPGDALREDKVNSQVSAVAAIPEVRHLLVEKQREYLQLGSLIMEGRDIGSVVFPNTPYKIYIDASEEVRLARRSAEGVCDAVSERDRQDSKRKVSPLVVADGATVIDSSEMNIDEVVEAAFQALCEKGLSQS